VILVPVPRRPPAPGTPASTKLASEARFVDPPTLPRRSQPGAKRGGPLLAAAAVVGGFAFELLAVRPVWNFFFRFGSEPALTLESAITDVATAVTGFNPEGEGLVKIELDGQIVQVLARLTPADRAIGTRVHAGDTLMVEDVDAVRNCCTVSLPAGAAGTIRGA